MTLFFLAQVLDVLLRMYPWGFALGLGVKVMILVVAIKRILYQDQLTSQAIDSSIPIPGAMFNMAHASIYLNQEEHWADIAGALHYSLCILSTICKSTPSPTTRVRIGSVWTLSSFRRSKQPVHLLNWTTVRRHGAYETNLV
jgi:hypothetical protein